MAFSDLVGDIGNSGFWGGLQTYIGNNTAFGQTANALDNAYQGLTGQPKQQLIGQPANQTNPSRSQLDTGTDMDQPLPQASKADMIKAHANAQQQPLGDNSQFTKVQAQPLQAVIAPQIGGQSGSGIGQLAGIAGMALI